MSTQLLVATGNRAKLQEFRTFLGDEFDVIAPQDIGLVLDVIEDATTVKGNAKKKLSVYLQALSGKALYVLADDTGLEIDALSGAPGPLTKRWLGGGRGVSDEDLESHCLKLLGPYSAAKDRGATFRTVICLGSSKEGFLGTFEGTLRGTILKHHPINVSRVKEFPFRDIFYVTEYGKTIGQLDALKTQLNILLAREIALDQVKRYLAKK